MANTIEKIAQLLKKEGPYLSLYLNTEAKKEEAPREIEIRWRDFKRDLKERGAPQAVLDEIDDVVARAHQSGDGLALVATTQGVVLSEHLSNAIEDSASWGPVPRLLPWLEWVQDRPGYAVVLADRTGADIYVNSSVKPDWSQHVEGDDFPVQRVNAGGWSQRRFQQRAENLWEQNAKEVAGALAKIVRDETIELVVLTGDVRAVSFLREHLPGDFPDAVLDLHVETSSLDEIADELDKGVAAFVAQSTDELLDKFQEERGQQDLAVEGFDATCEVLREARVATLFVPRDPRSSMAYFIPGTTPLQVGAGQQALAQLNIGSVERAPGIDLLVASALSAGSNVRVLPHLPADLAPKDGIGALLRFDYSGPDDDSDTKEEKDEEADEAAEESFPASDPPAW